MANSNATIVPHGTLDRIRRTVDAAPDALPPATVERQHLRDLSTARASQWPNTLDATRAKKERNRLERLEKEEGEKKKVDAAEAKRRAGQRQLHIERANKMLFDDTDRVKAFHSQLLLSDVLHEREAQIEYKKKIAQLHKKREAKFVERQKQALDEAESKELSKLYEAQQRAYDQRDAQLLQLDDVRDQILAERAEVEREGLEIQKKAKEEEAEHKRKEEHKRELGRSANLESVKANNELQEYRRKERMKIKEEDRKIEQYLSKKDQMTEVRRAKEEEKAADRAHHRNKMVTMLEKQLLDAREETEQRQLMQHREAEERADHMERMRLEELEMERDAIHRSRQQQLDIRRTYRDVEKAQDDAFVEHWKVRSQQIAEEQEQEKIMRFEKAKNLQSYHLKQQNRKANLRDKEREQEMAEAVATRMTLEEDDAMYKQYTQICIDEWSKRKRNIKPMVLQVSRKDTLSK